MGKSIATTELQSMAEILKAIAHNERLAILRLLRNSPDERLTVKTIYEQLNLSQPIVSRHLNVMKSVGVVRRQQEGQKTYYCLCTEKKEIDNLSKCFC
jgi:ArsR family transcriptional regulator, arsenate/arsenite/antimonite-responsive transcriptional repressor